MVAQEVKNLAASTATSTDEIADTVCSLRRDADAVSLAVQEMGQRIVGVVEATSVLGGVAREQYALVERLDQILGITLERVRGMTTLTVKPERRRAVPDRGLRAIHDQSSRQGSRGAAGWSYC